MANLKKHNVLYDRNLTWSHWVRLKVVSRDVFLPVGPREESILLHFGSFKRLLTFFGSWSSPSPWKSKIIDWRLTLRHSDSFCHSSSIFKDACDYTGLIWHTQNNFPMLRSMAYQSYFHLQLNFLSLCNVMLYPQGLRIRGWMSLVISGSWRMRYACFFSVLSKPNKWLLKHAVHLESDC